VPPSIEISDANVRLLTTTLDEDVGTVIICFQIKSEI
jgi:hypothetical protein